MVKPKLSRKEVKEQIEKFFRKKAIYPKGTRKIKRLAMKYHFRLGEHRKRFCKCCFTDLKMGNVRITKDYKTVSCGQCKEKNRWKL
jgi:hypothetical protein